MTEDGRIVVDDFIVEKRTGKAFVVQQGDVMRVIQIGGGQVADIKFLNADDTREQFSAAHSMMLNTMEGVEQPYFRMKHLYSKPPFERVLLTVVEDTVGVHTFGSHCSKRAIELAPEMVGDRSCQHNFEDCLPEFGLSIEDTEASGVFVAFMPRRVTSEGAIDWPESPAKDGDHIDFRAEVNVLVAFSNCPCGPPVNPLGNRDMRVQILRKP